MMAMRKNPLTRVTLMAPSMTTGLELQEMTPLQRKRLMNRRAKTKKAPKGFYANPLPEYPMYFRYIVEIKVESIEYTYRWLPYAGFVKRKAAEEFYLDLIENRHYKSDKDKIRLRDYEA